MTSEERNELLAAYALGGLSAADASAVEELARSDPAAARELAEYQEVADLIALDAPLQAADPMLRARVLRDARRTERAAGRRIPILRTLAVAAVVGAFALSLGWALRLQGEVNDLREEAVALQAAGTSHSGRIDVLERRDVGASDEAILAELSVVRETQKQFIVVLGDPDRTTAELVSAASGHGASGRCVWSASLNAGVVIARDLPPLPLGTLYEVWLDDGVRMVSAGTFLPAADGEADVLIELDEAFAPRFVTIATAPPGGAGSLQPPIVLSGDFIP
ncbi:MAG: hypothetical protein F4X25_13595 [Chloroflexi bacterium]|nr:hypothetical protein [Chloroflexota bacterium]